MARKLRAEYPGAIYHGMNRGDWREPIVKDAADRLQFLETLGGACVRSGWQVHAYYYPRSAQYGRARKSNLSTLLDNSIRGLVTALFCRASTLGMPSPHEQT